MKYKEWLRPYRIVIILLILTALSLRIPILKVRFFDPDEFQHLHSARQIYHGQLPYRDYFEHHTPLIHFILSTFYPFFGEEIRILFAARFFMLILTCVILYLTYFLGKTVYDTDTGLFAALFLAYNIMFLEKTLEIRPDLGAVNFWLLALIFTAKGIQSITTAAKRSPVFYFAAAGLAMGTAVMFTQKSLFAFGGLCLSFLWMIFDPRIKATIKRKIQLSAICIAFVMVSIALVCIYFLINKGLWNFINYNFIMNSQWKYKFWPYNYIKRLISQNPFFCIISILGVLIAQFWIYRRDKIYRGSVILVLSSYVLVGGLFIMPVPYRQYYQLFLPLLAIHMGLVFKLLSDIKPRVVITALKDRSIKTSELIFCIIVLIPASIGLYYTLQMAKPVFMESRSIYLLIWGIIAVLAIPLFIINRAKYAMLLISIGIISYPFQQTIDQLKQKNDGQLAAIRYIMDITDENDSVLDGWSGYGFLREHAYRYYFLHYEMKEMLTEKQLSLDIIESLEKKKTKVIIYDGSIQSLPGKLQEYIKLKYKPSGFGNIWVRKEV
ncbi:hypothetical protein GF312_06010 [Candidatus Poribacteria bacterium]|nr:hypothetical protein [Candidatus Poribacteria bacterium]